MAGNATAGQPGQVEPERGIDVKDRPPEKGQVRRLKLERGLLRAVTKLALAIATDALTGGRPAKQHLRRKACRMHSWTSCLPACCVMCDVAERSGDSWQGSQSQTHD